jgi:hypothetical protein
MRAWHRDISAFVLPQDLGFAGGPEPALSKRSAPKGSRPFCGRSPFGFLLDSARSFGKNRAGSGDGKMLSLPVACRSRSLVLSDSKKSPDPGAKAPFSSGSYAAPSTRFACSGQALKGRSSTVIDAFVTAPRHSETRVLHTHPRVHRMEGKCQVFPDSSEYLTPTPALPYHRYTDRPVGFIHGVYPAIKD